MSDLPAELVPDRGWIAPALAEEFPELALEFVAVEARDGRSPRALRSQLRLLANRFGGAQAIVMRQWPVPWAYRVFYRHIGLDPDSERTPVEGAVLQRLIDGGFRSRGLVADALTIALVETGVPVWALDAATVSGDLGLRLSEQGEPLGAGNGGAPLPGGRIVVADGVAALGMLFGDTAPGHAVTAQTDRVLLYALKVAGVPEIHVEEALWSAVETLRSAA
jgi:DNA/RNA-binding domain of Phe-tRNA-synthetase-like protein